MRALHVLLLSTTLCLGCRSTGEPVVASTPASAKPQAPPSAEHAWLGQLVGEWDVTAVAQMGPDVEPMTFENRTSARWIGGLWVLLESNSEDFTALMMLGHDASRGGYTGTWVDSMTPTLWVYSGRLEEDGKALVLEAEGPNPQDPSQRMQGRDTVRVLGPDHLQLTSELKDDAGNWNQFMSADYRRRKS